MKRKLMSYPVLVTALFATALWTAAVIAQDTPRTGAAPGNPLFALDVSRLLEGDSIPDVIISPNSGVAVSRVLDGATLGEIGSGFPFGGFGGGVRMAAGDLTGDGVVDIVSAMGPGGGLVKLLNGVDASEIGGGFPFGAGFGGGVNVAVGEFNGDGRLDIVTAQATGGGGVSVFNGVNYALLFSVQPFGASYSGGVNVATGDVNADGVADIIAGQANGGLVSIVNGATRTVILSGVPFGGGGVFVAAGDVNGDGRADVMAAPSTGPGPVLVYDVNALAALATFTPYGAGYPGGVRLAATDLNGDGRVEILTVPGPGGQPVMKVYDGATFANTNSVLVYPQSFTNGLFIAVPAATDLRFTSAAATTFTTGTAGTFTVQVAGSPLGTSIALMGALPSGVTFTNHGNGTATLDGTAAAGTGGTYVVSISASNGVGAPTVQSFTLTVNQAPAITSATAINFSTDAPGTFTVNSTGFPRATLAVTGTLPAGVTFTSNGDGTGTLAGSAGPGTSGTYPLSFTASNGVGAVATQSFVLTIDSAPIFTSAAATSFVAGTPGTFTITTSALPTATTITRTGALPAGVTFTNNGNGTATLAGTPGASTGGTYPLTFTASNGVGSVPQSFTLTVQEAPTITSANAMTFTQGMAGTFSVTTTAFPAVSLVLTGALPSGVTFTSNGTGTGTLTGTPAAGTGGSYPVSVSASNGVGSPAVQAFTLNVSAAPAITSANTTSFLAGAAGSFTVTTTGGPAAATISRSGALPTGVTFTDNGNGTATLAGMPAASSGGIYPLTITANNGFGTQAQQNFTLTVNQVPAITSAVSTSFTLNTAGTFTITTSGFPVPTATVTGTMPAGVTFTANGSGGGTIAGTPTSAAGSPFTLTINASNVAGAAAPQTFTLTVNLAPLVGNDDTFSNGVGNTQYSVGAGAPATPAVVVAGSVLSNDTGTATLAAGPANIATTNLGQVTMSSDGSFLYTPRAGFAGPSDSFTYTVTDGSGFTDTAVVTINMSGVVWYVNAAAAGGGDGRSQSPFNAMPAAAAAAQTNQIIYVHPGSPIGVTALKASQTLWGAGATYTLNGLTIPATSAPTLQGTVNLANNVALNAINVNGVGGAAISGSSLTGTETLTAVSIVGGTSGVNLTDVTGTFAMTGGAISGVSGADVLVSGGTAAINISTPITSTSGRSIDIQNRTGGTVTFSGAIIDSGGGIILNNNTATTIAFSGGLALSTDTSDAFTATAGGTITVTQNNTSIVNTVATTDGVALRVVNTQIGAAGLTFRSISAGSSQSSAGAGIVLDTTGVGPANGGLTVTGNGPGLTGGKIWRKTGPDGSVMDGVGIYLNGTKNAAFNRIELNNFTNSAIVGRDVFGFLLADSLIEGAGSTSGLVEGPLMFGAPNPGGVNGLQGSGLIRNTIITDGFEHNAAFYNQSGSMDLRIDRTTASPLDCQLARNSSTAGGSGLLVQLEGTATGVVTVDQCRLRDNRLSALRARALGSSNLTVTVNGSEVVRTAQGLEGVVLSNGNNAQLTGAVINSYVDNFDAAGVRIGQESTASALSMLRATVTGNAMEKTAGSVEAAIVALLTGMAGEAAPARLLIDGNLIHQYATSPGIRVATPTAGTSPLVDLTVTNNHVDMHDPANAPLGIVVQASQPSPSPMCANISSNSSHWYPVETNTGGGISLEQSNGALLRLERGALPLATPAATVLETANSTGPAGPSSTAVLGTVAVVENGVCQVP